MKRIIRATVAVAVLAMPSAASALTVGPIANPLGGPGIPAITLPSNIGALGLSSTKAQPPQATATGIGGLVNVSTSTAGKGVAEWHAATIAPQKINGYTVDGVDLYGQSASGYTGLLGGAGPLIATVNNGLCGFGPNQSRSTQNDICAQVLGGASSPCAGEACFADGAVAALTWGNLKLTLFPSASYQSCETSNSKAAVLVIDSDAGVYTIDKSAADGGGTCQKGTVAVEKAAR